MADGDGTRENRWKLETPSGGSAYGAYRDEQAAPPALVVHVGTTQLRYHLRCLDDLHAMLVAAVPPVIEALGLAEVEHQARNNRMRAAGG